MSIYQQIEIVREQMQRLWNEKGYTDPEVLKVSIKLDGLLNEYQRMVSLENRHRMICKQAFVILLNTST